MVKIKSLLKKKKFKERLIDLNKLNEIIKPGFRIFLSSGPATPVNAIRYIAETSHENFQDLELIQLNTPKQFEFLTEQKPTKFRFKTFSIGENVQKAMGRGLIDVVPTNIAELPYLFLSGAVKVDVAIVQTSFPDKKGNMNLGTVNDITQVVLKKADIIIAEANPNVPRTMGNSNIPVDKFDYIIKSNEPLVEYNLKQHNILQIKIAEHIASLIEDGSTVSLSMGSLFNAIACNLYHKKNLSIWTHIISDWIISLLKSGSIKKPHRSNKEGSVVSTYCMGTKEVYDYINNNPNIALYPLFETSYQQKLHKIKKLVGILDVNKIDITGETVVLSQKDLQITGFDSKMNFAIAATHSRDGKVIVGLPSLDSDGNSNIVINHNAPAIQNRCAMGTIRYVVTEFGIANIFGKSIRERVLSLIEIAHPDHRQKLFNEAKKNGLIFSDQIYSIQHGLNYPYSINITKTFGNDLTVKFRAVKPSDEEMIRRLFYQFPDETKYLRYFSNVRTMPHNEVQCYVDIDYLKDLSIVGIIQERGIERIIAECRYSHVENENIYEMVFITNNEFQRKGIGTYMLELLQNIGKERGIERLSAYVLRENKKMISIFEKSQITSRVFQIGDKIRYDFYL